MKSFTDTIDDLSIALFEDEGNDRLSCVDQLITSVKSTMSDRGPINPCFNKQLKTFREQLLPNVIDKWETFDEQLKNSLSDMCNFLAKCIYCQIWQLRLTTFYGFLKMWHF